MFNKKILCLGNNSDDTDLKVSQLATQDHTINHGLINNVNDNITAGYYHTTVVDLVPGEIVSLTKKFDQVLLLDQPIEQWSHPVMFTKTMHLIETLTESNYPVVFQNPNITENKNFFKNLLETNKSFCIYPFMHFISRSDGKTNLCSRSSKPVTEYANLNWQTNAEYQDIRNKMLAGTPLPEYCSYCYNLEKPGGRGVRFFDTMEWVNKLNINSLEDLKNITAPAYYEIRPSNKCNLQCRSCVPRDSHLIDREFKAIGMTGFDSLGSAYNNYTGLDIVDINSVKLLYLAGGEPTIMPELYDFLRKCIDNNTTDFEFMINTNAEKISKPLMDLFRHFSKLGFSVSLDGVGAVNDYIRWPSSFNNIVRNTHALIDQGHHVAFISVVSIYNITSLHALMEFQDQEFHGVPVMLQFNTFKDDIQSAYNHPDAKLALESLEKCKQTNAYLNYSRGTKSIIDQLYNHYAKQPECDLERLEKFVTFNNKLDHSRNHRLEDYIPDLAKTLLRYPFK